MNIILSLVVRIKAIIMKTSLLKYTENFTKKKKKRKFQIKILIFFVFLLKTLIVGTH